MKRPSKKDYEVKTGNSSLLKWGEYSKAQDEYINELENKVERLNKLYHESQTNLMISDMANRKLSDIINELTERSKRWVKLKI